MSYKNIYRFILIAVVLTAFFASPLAVTAGSEVYTEGFLEYYIVDDAIEICGYFGTGGEVVVPSSIAIVVFLWLCVVGVLSCRRVIAAGSHLAAVAFASASCALISCSDHMKSNHASLA